MRNVSSIPALKSAAKAVEDFSPSMMANLLHNLPGMAYRCYNDPDYTMIFMSEGCKRLTGYSITELLNNKSRTFTSLIHPDDIDTIRERIDKAISNRRQFVLEYRITKKNGALGWMWEQGNAIFNADGEVIYLDGYIAEITQYKKMEAELRYSAKEMQELNAAKDRFFSLIAHDLRNPVYAIISLAEFLSSNYGNFSSEELLSFVNQIDLSAKGIYSLLENLLDWARVQSGSIRIQKEKISLSRLIMNVLEHFRPYYTSKSIIINFSPAQDTFVYLDARILSSIMRNLIHNAIKFSYPGTKVEIAYSLDKDKVKIAIIDKGIGISRRQLERIFSLDRDERSFGTNQEPGSGLRLVLAKEFCDLIEAKITVTSKLNHGSTFNLILPLIAT